MQNKKTLAWVILITLSLVWGSSFILMKRGMVAFSSDEVAAMRISIAFLFLSPLLIKHYKLDLKKYWLGLIFMGVFGNLIPAFLFTKAETQISSGLAGMLNALTPLFTIIVSLIWLRDKPSKIKIVGVLIGFLAAISLMLFNDSGETSNNVIYSLLVVAATFCYAISINGIKKYLHDLNSVKATVWAFCFTGPVALIYLFGFSNFTTHLSQHPEALNSLGYVSILAIFGTAISVIIYNNLIKLSGVIFASSCTYLIPVVAVLWGLFDSETINIIQIISILVIILSVYLINKPPKVDLGV
ncbi:MAG: EamA family transporter [Bacteroidota bacterium]|nr:EamA family transporter [Bacteroidota bacterium]